MDTQPSKDPIPEFATREEIAEFWDTHDFADYWDDLTPVSLEVADELGMAFLISPDADQFNQLLRLANDQGVDFDALAREWVVERLQDADAIAEG